MLIFDKEYIEHASLGGWMEEAYRFFLNEKCLIQSINSLASLQQLAIN